MKPDRCHPLIVAVATAAVCFALLRAPTPCPKCGTVPPRTTLRQRIQKIIAIWWLTRDHPRQTQIQDAHVHQIQNREPPTNDQIDHSFGW